MKRLKKLRADFKKDKPLVRLKEIESTQINEIRNEWGEVTTDTTEMKKINTDYNEQLYANKFGNIELDKFLETYSQTRLDHEEIRKSEQTNYK